jgi:hypothetical protein
MLGFLCWLSVGAAQAQEAPTVFVMGDQEATYEKLNQTYKQTLLEACDNDMKLAFEKWLHMMQEMESYADEINFDLDGIKVLMHVFWNTDGQIDHIGYFLRPNSRNVDTAELSAFLSSFSRQYTFPVSSDRKFMHYTKASFPTFSERAQR